MSRQSIVRQPWLPSSATQGDKPLRFCLVGGGTGGHVYPALAVAAALANASETKAQGQPTAVGSGACLTPNILPYPVDVVYIGSTSGMEQRIVEREGRLPYRGIPAAALRGRSPLTLARNGGKLAVGTLAALELLRRLRPASILGTGGYVCVPVFLAARLLGIPTLIYLPDVVPGLAVQALSRVATQIACSVEDSAPFFGKWVKIVQTGAHTTMLNAGEGNGHTGASNKDDKRKSLLITGYPVRANLFAQDRAACRRMFRLRDDLPVVVIYGGSRGARSINRAVQKLLGALLAETQLIHICGREGDEVWLHATAATLDDYLQARYRLYPFLEGRGEEETPSMVAALGAADLAVCRSGASVLGELPALGLPSIVVPYPYVHQEENADYLVRKGAAVKLADGAMVGDGKPHDAPLFIAITRLVGHGGTQERNAMAAQCRALARYDAAQCLAHALYNLAKRKG